MFDQVAEGYDRTNLLLSGGQSALWRRATSQAVNATAGERVLDVAAGTGTSSASLAQHGAHVTALDLSEGMVAVGRERHAGDERLTFVQGDATALPFDDASFDAVTISFGLRNVEHPDAALTEFFRVLKPSGRVVICEFSTPVNSAFRRAYELYLERVMPVLCRAASSNPPAYEYLMDSILDWPPQPVVASWLRDAGFQRVGYRNLTGGIVALHRGIRPVPDTLNDPTPTGED